MPEACLRPEFYVYNQKNAFYVLSRPETILPARACRTASLAPAAAAAAAAAYGSGNNHLLGMRQRLEAKEQVPQRPICRLSMSYKLSQH